MMGSEYKGTRVDTDGDVDGDEAYEMQKVPVTDEPESLETKDAGQDPGDEADKERNVLRGKTLGVFGPESAVRRAVYALLIHPYVLCHTSDGIADSL